MDSKKIESLIDEFKGVEGSLLPIFHSINNFYGFIDKKAIPIIALALNLSEAEVSGVLSFYHDFNTTPPKKNIIKICMAEACQSMGCDYLYNQISNFIVDDNQTSLEKIYCLGNCSLSPAAIINNKHYGRLTFEKVTKVLKNENQ